MEVLCFTAATAVFPTLSIRHEFSINFQASISCNLLCNLELKQETAQPFNQDDPFEITKRDNKQKEAIFNDLLHLHTTSTNATRLSFQYWNTLEGEGCGLKRLYLVPIPHVEKRLRFMQKDHTKFSYLP